MKKVILITLLVVACFQLNAQVPFYGSRLFVSADKQDTLYLDYSSGVPTWRSSKKVIDFKGGVKADSIYLGKWHKNFDIVTLFGKTETSDWSGSNWANTFFGYQAGQSIVSESGPANTFIGYEAGKSANGAQQNVAVGGIAGSGLSAGSYNTLVGYAAGRVINYGSFNVFLGYSAGSFMNSLSNRLVINPGGAKSSATQDSTYSIIYGYQGSLPSASRLRLNAHVKVSGNIDVSGDFYKNGSLLNFVQTETDPVYNAEKSQYLKSYTETDPAYTAQKSTLTLKADTGTYNASKYYVGKSIKDSLANIKTRLPVVTIKPTRDSVNYEMIGGGKSYKIPVTYTINRPSGSGTITAVNLAGKVIAPPAVNVGATFTGTDTIIFGQSPTNTTAYKKTFTLKVAAGIDTVKQDLILGQYWKLYGGPVAFYNGAVLSVDDYSFNSLRSQLLVDSKCFLENLSPAGSQLMIALPVEFVNKTIYINGLPYKFTQYATRSTNFVNSRGAAHTYKGLVSQAKIKGNIQSIEIK